MKKVLTSVAMVLLLAGCAQKYDDSGLREKITSLETRVTALEGNIQSIQSAIGDGVFVAKVQEFVDPDTGKTIGVTVTYTNGDVKYFEISPKADYDGPVLSVIKSGSGALVWAVDGVAILVDGKEVTVYQTPVFSIDEDGNLLVSIDGSDPVVIGKVQNEGATLQDGIFTDIKVEQDKVVLTLSDDTVVNIPFAEAFKLNIEKTEYSFTTLAAIEIPYTVSAKTSGTVVGVAGYSPNDFNVSVTDSKIVVTPVTKKAAGVLLAYADSKVGLTSIVSITIEAEGVEVTDVPYSGEFDYMADGEDAVVAVHVVSNVEFDVVPVDSWIHFVNVKASAHTITLSLDDNTTGAIRTGKVNLVKPGTHTSILQTIKIGQNFVEEGGVKNLSAMGSANCYIIKKEGEYCFDTVKGNSAESVGAVASAALVWETWNNDQEVTANSVIASLSYADGKITFSTPATLKPGNALIAAKDAGGNILWSWHIWIPETAIGTDTYGLWPTPMMDRNLGALVAAKNGEAAPVESFGMTFQWGRKDPFVGPKATSGSSNATVAGTEVKQIDATMTIEETIAQPTVIGHTDDADWLTGGPDNTLWQNDLKTIYDPCPPGYKVPARDKEQPLMSSDLSTVTGWSENATNGYVTMGDPLAIFPVSGYRDDYSPGAYSKVYQRVAYWTSYASSEKKGYLLNIRLADYGNAHALGEGPKARGGYVRCVTFEE